MRHSGFQSLLFLTGGVHFMVFTNIFVTECDVFKSPLVPRFCEQTLASASESYTFA